MHELLLAAPPPSELEKQLAEMVKLKSKDPATLESIGFAYLMLGKFDKARPVLEAAVAASAGTPSRDLVYNLGVVDLKQRTNAMRSVINIANLLGRPGLPPDEPLQDLFGSLIIAAGKNKPARKAPLFVNAVSTYVGHDAKLEGARRDGFTRWGGGWLSPAQKQADDKLRRDLQPQIDYLANDFEENRAAFEAAKKRAEKLRSQVAFTKSASDKYELRVATERAAHYDREAIESKGKLDQVRRRLPARQWAESHEPILPRTLARLQADDAAAKVATVEPAMPEPVTDAAPVDGAPTRQLQPEPELATAEPEAPRVEAEVVAEPVKANPRPIKRSPDERAQPTATSIFDFGDD
ncbi:MAG TPA: hypothetical protein VGN72_07885 [Tepidisphaeraceae bacterium]|nr:hypothetical protein [Tepidisphaeraceae bacterium]